MITNRKPFRLAIIGGGPRGLFALESLTLELAGIPDHSRRSIAITIFEPSPFPGAGNVYDPRQPEFLLMNFSVEHINLWSEKRQALFPGKFPDLDQWIRKKRGGSTGPHDFVPRSMVGSYLHDGFRQLRNSLPRGVSLRVVPEKAVRIWKNSSHWTLASSSFEGRFDSVVVTTGHEGWRHSAPSQDLPVFPVREKLSEAKIPRNSEVRVRGFALTWIDATLALTEGRGGAFQRSGQDTLTYRPGGTEPARIMPFSRTGLPMLPKPDRSRFTSSAKSDAIWNRYKSHFRALPSHVDFNRDIRPLIFSAADEFGKQSSRSWFRQWTSGDRRDPAAILSEACAMATAEREADPSVALAEAWRKLYEPIVRSIEHGRLTAQSWPDYRKFASELERIAFGPPVVNVQKMLALHRAGILSFEYTHSPPENFDYTIDARIPSPLSLAPDSPLRILEDQGLIRRLHHSEGFEVDRAGRAINSEGRCLASLAVFGRATEGCTIGNDTLSRTLNPHLDRWASILVTNLISHDNYQFATS